MSPDFKNKLKRKIARYPLLALWIAKLRSTLLGIMALPFRLRFSLTAYVPFSVKLVGIRRIAIGHNTVIGAHSWLNVNEVQGSGPALRIGEHCFIGIDNFFSVGRTVTVGDYCLTTKGCSFIGATHVYDDPMNPFLSTGVTNTADISVGVNCFFGIGAQVIGNVSIGHGCVIGAGAVVRENVPPFSLVVGAPARVIKRFDFDKQMWVKWPADHYTEGPQEAAYRTQLHRDHGAPVHHISAAAGALRDLA